MYAFVHKVYACIYNMCTIVQYLLATHMYMSSYNDFLPGDLHVVLAQLFVFTAFGVTCQFGI